MYIIVVGCGRVGAQLARMLANEKHNVVVIDENADFFSRLGPAFNGVTIVGSGFDKEVLVEAGIERADAFAAVTTRDNTNIMAAQVAKEIYQVPVIVARVNDPGREKTYQQLGLDIIGGTTLMAKLMKHRITQANYSADLSALDNGDFRMINFLPTSEIVGKAIGQLEKKDEFKIVLVKKDKKLNMVEKEYVLGKEDLVFALVKTEKLKKYEDYFAPVSSEKGKK